MEVPRVRPVPYNGSTWSGTGVSYKDIMAITDHTLKLGEAVMHLVLSNPGAYRGTSLLHKNNYCIMNVIRLSGSYTPRKLVR